MEKNNGNSQRREAGGQTDVHIDTGSNYDAEVNHTMQLPTEIYPVVGKGNFIFSSSCT